MRHDLMGTEPEHPEIPFPLPPLRTPPRRTEPVVVPMVAMGGGDAWERLDDQRRVLVGGRLDHAAVTELAAKLMAFDGASGRDVDVVINSPGGPVADLFALLDVLTLMRSPTNTTVIGSAAGTAVAVVACGTGTRRTAPNATFSLRVDEHHTFDGATTDVVRDAEQLDALKSRYVAALAAATGLDGDRLTNEISHGRFITASDACDLGIVDTIVTSPHRTSRNETS